MKTMHSAPPEKAWRLGKGPFVFSGIPPACSGELELINTSEEKVKVRAIPVAHEEGDRAAGVLRDVQLAARIAPHGRAKVPAHFFVDPGTPSGIYQTVLTCGEQRETAVVHVLENVAFEIRPQRIVLRGAGGDTLSRSLVITNTGNVPLSLPDVSMVWLEETDWVGRTLVYTLRESPESETHQEFLDRTLKNFRSAMVPATRVFFEGQALEIKPGDVVQLDLKLVLPKELKKGRTYLGFVKLPGRRLWLTVECNGGLESERRRRK